MHHFSAFKTRRLRRLILVASLTSLAMSGCGTPDRAAPTTQAQAVPATTVMRPTAGPPATADLPTTISSVPAQKATAQPTTLAAEQGQATATPIPECTFSAAAGPEPQVPALEAYSFSEPKVILTGQSIGIADWLPDDERILITRADYKLNKQAIELINVDNGTVERLAAREGFGAKPVWLDLEQAVAFADVGSQKQIILRIARRQDTRVEDIASDLATPYLAAQPHGRQIVTSSKSAKDQLQVIGVDPEQRQMHPITPPLVNQSLSSQREQNTQQGSNSTPPRASWSPNGSQIALFDRTGLYLNNTVTGQTCTIDLGMYQGEPSGKLWATAARWSPDGRFISLLVTSGEGLPLPFQHLKVLNVVTGEQRDIDLQVSFVFETAWTPKSHQIVALGSVGHGDDGRELLGLYIVDTSTGKFRQILSNEVFDPGVYLLEGGGLALSPKGDRVLVKCPVFSQTMPTRVVEDRVCQINLTIQF